ncbi:cation diffusion facilitator family transporter [Paenibacillus macquariensis]|uniref:Cation diffusion facilitator family transporter n=1 Tax=Paenibacillus macquariensis TaxID=948756 RepID=A0ABY1K676_9BACL|nr:cation diffusion facilitator family transporter [Paenibacillus macquariensis]MEC0090569.1 cation diffusion facilitator family transporter [Paenibacillus macquariensis]OAB38566.1 transporter [Paenibacillus macquariensis subsp. macquariensis]SIR31374.1 cation diffusion facilitator family transporter [Paenibacillus macquariensis]
MDAYNEIREGEKGAWVSIIAYVCLSALKLFIGFTAGSEALLADGLNNTTDIIASFAVLIGLKISRRPPDHDHKYGHFRAETVAALVASFIMIAVGAQVLYQAVQKFFEPTISTPNMIAAWTALFSALVMMFVYRYNIRLARRINSHAITAAAQDNRSDALVSIGAFIGIVGSQFGLPWLDPLTATLVGLIIVKTAWDIFKDASHALTDGFDEKELVKIKQTVADTPGVESIKDIKARILGNNVLVDVTIQVNGYLNVVESHDISEEIEDRMLTEHKISHIHVHIEPIETLD